MSKSTASVVSGEPVTMEDGSIAYDVEVSSFTVRLDIAAELSALYHVPVSEDVYDALKARDSVACMSQDAAPDAYDDGSYVLDTLTPNVAGTVTLEEYRQGKRVPFLTSQPQRHAYSRRLYVAVTENGTHVTVFRGKDGESSWVRLGSRSVQTYSYATVYTATCRCGWKVAVKRDDESDSELTLAKWVLLHLAKHAHADGL